MAFRTIEEKFNALVTEWRRLRESGSSTDSMINDAYGQIVAMNWPVVPLLLREVERESGHWFTALKWITSETIVTPEMRGNILAMREAWLDWGKKCASLKKLQKDNGSSTTFPTFQSTAVISPAGQHGITTVLVSPLVTTSGGTLKSDTNTTGLVR